MKKIVLVLCSFVLTAGILSAQDINQATDTYNFGATALSNGEKESALASFQQALSEAMECGEDGAELVANCKDIIPTLHLSIAKDFIKDEKYDDAVAKLKEAAEVAKEYGSTETSDEATELIPQVFMQKGNSFVNAKKYAEAAEAYKSLLEIDATNGMALLRLGVALTGAGDNAGAIEAFKKAADNGQANTAKKQLANIYLKQAAADLKAKKYAEAIVAAEEVGKYAENAQAYLVAGQASQQLKKNNEAIAYFEKYLTASPNAKNAPAISFTVAALYQQAGNKEKAVEFYQKVATDPTYGGQAKAQLDALK